MKDVFGPGSNFKTRFVSDEQELITRVEALKKIGLKIVLTSGTFDLQHIGHFRYLEQAKERGDILVVGVDSDERTRQRKGEGRPIVSQDERMESLCHTRHVDLIVLKGADDPKHHLVKIVCPHTLITSEGEHSEEVLAELRKICGEVVVLPRQAETSTSAKIRSLLVGHALELKKHLDEATKNVVRELENVRSLVDKLLGGN